VQTGHEATSGRGGVQVYQGFLNLSSCSTGLSCFTSCAYIIDESISQTKQLLLVLFDQGSTSQSVAVPVHLAKAAELFSAWSKAY
jgi:hypothetical protein